jgi:hypothetical protein
MKNFKNEKSSDYHCTNVLEVDYVYKEYEMETQANIFASVIR